MISQNRICSTLKEKLFLDPKPLAYLNEEFFALHDRIFPGKELFISFLDTSEEQQKKEIAKEILLRLCYESNFAPIYGLTLNVLNMEEKLSGDKYTNYVGRDHFIHLVNLYLLGVYIFFYNLDFNKKLYNSFRLKRTSLYNESIKLNAVKDFISSWKYFVVYHDLAYPFEFFGSSADGSLKNNRKIELKDIEKEVLRFFSKDTFKDSFIFELSIKAISKLIVINRELKYLGNDFKNVFSYIDQKVKNERLFKKDIEKFETINSEELSEIFEGKKISDIYKLQNIHTGESIKYILSVFRKSDLIYVVSNSTTGHIIAIVIPDKNSEHKVLFTEQNEEYTKLCNSLSETPQMFLGDECLYKNIYIDYYIIDPFSKFDSFLKSVASFEGVNQREIKRDSLDLVYSSIYNGISDPTIVSDSDFLNYSFQLYKNIREALVSNKKGYSYSFSDIQKETYKNYTSSINRGFTEACTQLIKTALKDTASLEQYAANNSKVTDVKELIRGWTEAAIKLIIDIPWKENCKTDEADSIASKLIDEYSKSFQAKLILRKINECIVEKMEVIFKDIKPSFYLVNNADDTFTFNDEVIDKFEPSVIEEINSKICRSFRVPDLEVKNMISNYKLDYSKYDHGIYGLKIYLEHLSFYRHYLNKCITDESLITKGALLPWHVDDTLDLIKTKYLDKYDNLIPEIAFSLMMHNIYPAKFDDKKYKNYRTSINTESFAYYAILCDSIQHWNRPFILNPALQKVNKSILSNFFNIEVEEKEIKIYIECSNNNESIDYINKLSLALEEYLSDANHKIRIIING